MYIFNLYVINDRLIFKLIHKCSIIYRVHHKTSFILKPIRVSELVSLSEDRLAIQN